jgi:hypothetical protein
MFASNGALFCGTGNWHNNISGQGPQIIRLNSPGGNWEIEQTFDPDTIAVACLHEIHFPTANINTLVCGFFGRAYVGIKNNGWNLTRVGEGGQIRSFAAHIDNRTGVNMAFAGQNEGIFSGVYDAVLPGEIQWTVVPELNIKGLPLMAGGHPERVMSFAEVNGVLHATVGQRLYRRNDGHPSSWTEVWKNPIPGISQSGLRGLTSINGNLWACVEGTQSRIIKFAPGTYEAFTEFDLSGPQNFYIIGAYNNMCVASLNGSQVILCGIDAGADAPAHYVCLYQGNWRRIAIPTLAPKPMRSCRTIILSPFNNTDVYYGGFDCYKDREHDTAWIVRSTLQDAVQGG